MLLELAAQAHRAYAGLDTGAEQSGAAPRACDPVMRSRDDDGQTQ